MKKAKIILTSVAILAVIGGALAFKATRFNPPTLWTLLAGSKVTSTTTNGIVYSTTVPNCVLTDIATTTTGPLVVATTTSTRAAVTTVFTTVIGGQPTSFTTVYPFCTTFLTRTAVPNI